MKLPALFPKDMRSTDREVWRIVLPCLLEMMLTYGVGMVTTAMIGRLSGNDISAQGIGQRITDLVMFLAQGIGIGVTVLVGIHFGAGKLNKCRKVSEQSMLIAFGISALCVIGVYLIPNVFIGLFTDDPVLTKAAETYLFIAVWRCPGAALARIVTAAFNGQGNTRTPLVIAVLTNVINAVVGYVLIFGLGPIPALGLKGAAIGQVVANTAGFGIGLLFLYGRRGLYRGVKRDGRLLDFEWADIKKVFATGIPAGFENMMFTFAGMIISRALLSYTSDVYAGYQLASQCEAFISAPAFGFQTAAVTLTARFVGMKDPKALREHFVRICVLSMVISVPCMVLMIGFPGFFMRLLTDKPVLREIGTLYLIIVAIAFIPQMLNMISFGAVRSLGYKNVPLIGTTIGLWGIRVLSSVLAAYVFHAHIGYAFAGMALDHCVRLVIVWTFMKKKRLMRKDDALGGAGSPEKPDHKNQYKEAAV